MSALVIERSLSSGSTVGFANWSPSSLVPGPKWSSFEPFRVAGNAGLESIKTGTVATLLSKAGQFRILRDEDFQRLIGLASEVHRIRSGVTVVIQAARVVAKHKDKESIDTLIGCVSMLEESSVLPERDGHGKFELTGEDLANSSDVGEIDLDNIPRPSID